MIGQVVFEKMVAHHESTGQVLQGRKFVWEIVRKHDIDQVIDGLIAFNQYLDDKRLENEEVILNG